MARISHIRPLLLTAPYSVADDPEIIECFPSGPRRTVGLIEVTLETGEKGWGEGYLAVFAPEVFRAIADLIAPHLIGRDGFAVAERCRDMRRLCDYWSLQGAARHVLSAVEIALQDARARSLGRPLWSALGAADPAPLIVYGSGGCCATKAAFMAEFDWLEERGIGFYKIRSTAADVRRTAWVLGEAARRDIRVAVDMCQNLSDPPQTPETAAAFVDAVHALSPAPIYFLEEAVGPADPRDMVRLRALTDVPVAGGEIITTPLEMQQRIAVGAYAIAQPDASVIGGIDAVREVFAAARSQSTEVIVHAWGGPVAILANWHASLACGGRMAEVPMLPYALADTLAATALTVRDGLVVPPRHPGLGIEVTPAIEAMFPYKPDAVYCCDVGVARRPPDSDW